MTRPATLAALKESGWTHRSVKEEIRANLIEKIKNNEPVFTGIIGYGHTVIPDLENALLAGHDIILLGERGQAKTRIIRSLTTLLDEYVPAVEGCEINDNPLAPACSPCRAKIARLEGQTPIEWIHRSRRYGEKLATPDVTIADLIGDIDPVKIAEGRYLSDESAIHYGLIPRTNRGIFSINELPDLHEKIQVGMFNLLEERDIQIRGHKIFLPLDVFIVATANPEDYTSRGRIITPLKDRFGAQVRTHYPLEAGEEILIIRQEMRPFSFDGCSCSIPPFIEEIIADISRSARKKADINQYAGISVRMSIHNMETIIGNAFRRCLRLGESAVVPRITDIMHLSAGMKGKIEWSFADDRDEEEKTAALIAESVQRVFRKVIGQAGCDQFLKTFTDGSYSWEVSEMTPASAYNDMLSRFPSLKALIQALFANDPVPAEEASAAEFVLESLALQGKITKQTLPHGSRYDAVS